jgi:hypothetical protein
MTLVKPLMETLATPIIPIELVIEMGKFDIWLYQKIRILSKFCYNGLKRFEPVGVILNKHTDTNYTYDNEGNNKYYTYYIYCPSRELTETGFVNIDCGYQYPHNSFYRSCKNYIKETRRWQIGNLLWMIKYVDQTRTRITTSEYDIKGRVHTRMVENIVSPFTYLNSKTVCYEIMWPKTNVPHMKFIYPNSCYREVRRPNGTLKYIEDRSERYNITRDYYDKTGTRIVAKNEYYVDLGRRRECINTNIVPGWH